MSASSQSRANVVIIGRPNVGKSALFNRLVKKSTAIVHDEPGITRDRISGLCKSGARPFTVWDTGGIAGKGETQLTRHVQQAVEQAMAQGDLLLFVVDGKHGLQPADHDLAKLVRRSRKPVILTVNKVDESKHEDFEVDFAGFGLEHLVSVSAAHGRGIHELLEVIDRLLPRESSLEVEEPAVDSLAIAVVGRPNAGKSSFINAVLSDERTIVSELPEQRATRSTSIMSTMAITSSSSIPLEFAVVEATRVRSKSLVSFERSEAFAGRMSAS